MRGDGTENAATDQDDDRNVVNARKEERRMTNRIVMLISSLLSCYYAFECKGSVVVQPRCINSQLLSVPKELSDDAETDAEIIRE